MPCIELICNSCGDRAVVSYESLSNMWDKGLENISPDAKKGTRAFTEAKCICGSVERYNTPMFDYVFQVVFQDFVREDEI